MNYLKAALWLFVAVIACNLVFGDEHSGPKQTSPQQSNIVTNDDNDCHAEVVATDGTPPPGTPTIDPARLCGALEQAENEAACMGDWQPPDPDRVNARELCLEIQRHGCGDPARRCDDVPSEQEYYTHH